MYDFAYHDWSFGPRMRNQLAGQGWERRWAMEELNVMANCSIDAGTIAEVAGQFDRTGRMCYDHFVG